MAGTSVLTVAVVAIGAIAIAATVFQAARGVNANDADSFLPKRLLTANELEFLARLEAAAPELRICPQVAMGALLEPSARRGDSKAYYRQRGRFSQKIVDFVAQRRSDGNVVAIIELDDRTHDADKDEKRDAMLSSAGYKVIRWESKAKPDLATIRAKLVPPPPSIGSTDPYGRIEPV